MGRVGFHEGRTRGRAEIMDDYYTIKDWDSVFETKASRRCTQERRFVLVPTKRQSDSYHALMATREGREAYCVFIGLCRIAATCPCRGHLIDDKGPWDVARAAPVLGIEARVVERAVEMLASKRIGWLVPSNAPLGAPEAHPKRTESAPEAHQETHQERTENALPKAPSSSRNWIGIGIGNTPPAPPQGGGSRQEKSTGIKPTRAERSAAKREAAQRAFDAAQAAEAQKRAQRAGVTHG